MMKEKNKNSKIITFCYISNSTHSFYTLQELIKVCKCCLYTQKKKWKELLKLITRVKSLEEEKTKKMKRILGVLRTENMHVIRLSYAFLFIFFLFFKQKQMRKQEKKKKKFKSVKISGKVNFSWSSILKLFLTINDTSEK